MSRLSTEPGPAPAEVRRLRELSPAQWKSGLAAWLGRIAAAFGTVFFGLFAPVALLAPDLPLD